MKKVCFLITLFIALPLHSQTNPLWKGYFSYNAIKDLSQSSNEIYAAAENVYFKRNTNTNEIVKKTTVEGLSGETITQIYHSEIFKKTLLGHVNGLIIVVNDIDGSVLNVVDIVNKPSIPPNKKQINHFMEYDGKVYVSTDFGINVFNLSNLQFNDSYFIGPNGSNIEIQQTTISNGFIYAAASSYGVLKADITNQNLIDYSQWELIAAGSLTNSIEKIGAELVGSTLNNNLIKFTGNTTSVFATLPQTPIDLRSQNGKLIITTQDYVYLYDEALNQTNIINSIPNFPYKFTSATIINSKIYIGTQENGIITANLSSLSNFSNITPDGPIRNKVFALKSTTNKLWVVYGDYNSGYNPFGLDSLPISKLGANDTWTLFPYESLFDAKSISRITVNPNNENQVYFSSYFSGLLKFENDIPTTIYNVSNSSLERINGPTYDDIRINGAEFDKSGNLWMTNSLVNKNLQVLKNNGQWQGYNLPCMANQSFSSFGRMTIDKNNTKWLTSNFGGLVGFNETGNKCINLLEGQGTGNLPSQDVRAVAVDNKNKLWIGTTAGLRVIQNVDSFLNQNSIDATSIIILEDDLAQELLYEQFITDIVVDGANNKWIGTSESGVFYISADGQKTFQIFNKDNSPLPSNIINDIEINDKTGEVFIATEKGLISFRGNATTGTENFDNAFAYPNPVRPDYNGQIFVSGLMDKANVKITDIEGNLVHEAISEGGTIQWDGKAFGKYKVASGVYMILMSSDDGAETNVKKVMIIR